MRNISVIQLAMIAVIISAVLAHYPCVKDIDISSVSKQRQIWTITGTITVNPQETPEELCYNRDSDGFLLWWEQHINEFLDVRGIPVQILELELWFVSTSETSDVIGFRVQLTIGGAKVVP